jgi:hypothetical protein
MNEFLKLAARSLFVSLRLTVVLLALSIVLIFWATLDQVHLGVWAVQQKFFHSFIVFVRVGDLQVPVYPGGYLIGGLLLANLVAAHIYRFKMGWRKAGSGSPTRGSSCSSSASSSPASCSRTTRCAWTRARPRTTPRAAA